MLFHLCEQNSVFELFAGFWLCGSSIVLSDHLHASGLAGMNEYVLEDDDKR